MFRKKPHKVTLAPPTKVYDKVLQTSDEIMPDGSHLVRSSVVDIDVTDPNYLKKFPNPLDVTLLNDLATGQPLQEVHVNLAPVDAAELDLYAVKHANRIIPRIDDIVTPTKTE